MSREYPRVPILAVSASLFHSNQLLMVQRAHPPAEGQWALPGGAVQLGETPEEALKREMMEECQLSIEIHRLNHVATRLFFDKAGRIQYHYIILNYLCTAGSVSVRSGSDALACKWIDQSKLHELDLAEGILETVNIALKSAGGSHETG
jgi:8-oxo-dGTP diphosphatase